MLAADLGDLLGALAAAHRHHADDILRRVLTPLSRRVAATAGPLRDVPHLLADDDAARYQGLFRALGFRTFLLARFDANTERVHRELAGEAYLPRGQELTAAVALLASAAQVPYWRELYARLDFDPRAVTGVHELQATDGDLRVDLRRRELHVTEQLLDGSDVGAVLEHVGGARVSEHGGAESIGQSHPFAGPAHRLDQDLGRLRADKLDRLVHHRLRHAGDVVPLDHVGKFAYLDAVRSDVLAEDREFVG